MSDDRFLKIQEFVRELSGFARQAESVLNHIEVSGTDSARDFSQFSEYMIAIRGTADQLHLPEVSQIAGLGEEIAIKAATAKTPNPIKKCLTSLWDALTTVKYMLENPPAASGDGPVEEMTILLARLESVLKSLGGKRETLASEEIDRLLRQRP